MTLAREQFNANSPRPYNPIEDSLNLMFEDTRNGLSEKARQALGRLQAYNEKSPDPRRTANLQKITKLLGSTPQNKAQPAPAT